MSVVDSTTIVIHSRLEIDQFFSNKIEVNQVRADRFFPENNNEKNREISGLALLRLVYLADINAYSEPHSPFTKSQRQIIVKSRLHNRITLISMGVGLVLCAVGLAGICYLGFVQDDKSSEAHKIGLATLAAAVNVLGVLISFWATGFSPHITSNAHNDRQDILLEMDRTYEDLGHKLIELFYSPDHQYIARQIAQKMPIDSIREQIRAETESKTRDGLIVQRIEEAIQFIKSENTTNVIWPENTQFKSFIEDKKRKLSPN